MSLPIRVGHTGKIETIALLSIIGVTNIFYNFPQQLVYYGLQAGWMIPIISMILMLFVLFVIRKKLLQMRQADFLTSTGGKIDRFLRYSIAILVLIFFIATTASDMRQFSESILGTVLSRSPLSFVEIPLLVVIIYFAFSGIESLTRLAWIFTPWFVVTFVILLIGNYNWMHPEYLMPILGSGIWPVVLHGILYTSSFSNIMLLFIFAGAIRNEQEVMTVGIASTLLIGIIYVIIMLAFVSIFPSQLSINMAFPVYQMARILHIGKYLERLESIYIFMWVGCAVIKMAAGIWVVSYLFARIFALPVYKPLVFSTGIIIYSLTFFPNSYIQTLHWDESWIEQWGMVVTVGIPFLLWLLRKRPKEEQMSDENTQTSS